MKKKRIIMISGKGPNALDGVADYTHNLLLELSSQKKNWQFIWIYKKKRWFHLPLLIHTNIIHIRISHNWGNFGVQLIKKICQIFRSNCIHIQEQTHSFHESNAAEQISQNCNKKIISTIHEIHEELPSIEFTKKLIHNSNYLIAQDTKNAEKCLQLTNKSVNTTLWSPSNIIAKESYQNSSQKYAFISFGHINPIKDLETTYEALSELYTQHKEINWKIIGNFEPDTNDYHQQLSQKIKEPWVEFTGALDVKNNYFIQQIENCFAILLPFKDGASMRRTSLHFAWNFGLATITNKPNYQEKDIINEYNALLIEDNNKNSWKQAIETLIQNQDLHKTLKKGSMETAEKFSWQKLAAEHIKIYESI